MDIQLTENQRKLADAYTRSTYCPKIHGDKDSDLFNLKKGVYGELIFEKFVRSRGISPVGERNFALVPDESYFLTRGGYTIDVKTSTNSYLNAARKTVERYPMQQYIVGVRTQGRSASLHRTGLVRRGVGLPSRLRKKPPPPTMLSALVPVELENEPASLILWKTPTLGVHVRPPGLTKSRTFILRFSLAL